MPLARSCRFIPLSAVSPPPEWGGGGGVGHFPAGSRAARLFGGLRRPAAREECAHPWRGRAAACAPGKTTGRADRPLSARPARRRAQDDIMRKCRPGAASPAAGAAGRGEAGRAGRQEGSAVGSPRGESGCGSEPAPRSAAAQERRGAPRAGRVRQRDRRRHAR
ncbi:uncharacterized protein LJ264_003503 [Porphyrio hochstetteri]